MFNGNKKTQGRSAKMDLPCVNSNYFFTNLVVACPETELTVIK